MAARENADKSLNQTDSLIQTNMNEFESSSAGNFRHDQVQGLSNDSDVAEEKGFKEQSHGAVKDSAPHFAYGDEETKIFIKESIMAARENADKSLNQTDSLVETNMNEFELSGAGNFMHDQAQGMSNDSAVAEELGFKEQSHGVVKDSAPPFAYGDEETKIFIKESIMAARENADKSLNQTDSLVETNMNEFELSGAGNFMHDQAQGMSNDSAVAEELGFKEQSHGVVKDSAPPFAYGDEETKIFIKESIMAAREKSEKLLNQTDSLVQTNMNEFESSGAGNFMHDQAQEMSNDSVVAEEKGFKEQSHGVVKDSAPHSAYGDEETKIFIKESFMAARENADKSLNPTDSLVQTNMNEFESSGAQEMSNDSDVAEEKGLKEQSHGVVKDSAPHFAYSDEETKFFIKESIMAARENADKSLNQTDSLVQTNMNEFESSGAGNVMHDQAQGMSNDSAVAEEKGFKEHSHGVVKDSAPHFAYSDEETKFFIKESIMAAGENADKSLNQTDSLVQTNMNEFESSSAGNFRHDQVQGMSNDSAVAEEKGFKEQSHGVAKDSAPHFAYGDDGNALVSTDPLVAAGGNSGKEKQAGSSHGKRKTKSGRTKSKKKQVIKSTVYVSDIDTEISEEQLAALFTSCGQVVDCRICGDLKSALRFGFVEFSDKEGAKNALSLAGTMLGSHTVKVVPSKTAIAPVNHNLLPRSEDEIERCTRTIYIANIDKKVDPEDVRLFFESFCGEVLCLKLLNDRRHSTRIGFLEFATSESAVAALKCSGVILGELPIRVSPSKTPIKQRVPRSTTE